MSPNSQSKKDVLTPSEREFVNRVRKSLEQYRLIDMTQNIHRELTGLKMIAESIRQYPSPFKTQTLGGRKRDMATLIDALANATFFTLDMVLPTRTLLGGAFITAKINFFRMLSYLIVEAFRDRKIQISLLNESHLFLSQAVYSKVTEALLSSMICDNKLSYTLRHRAARVALYMWEDRINREMADFFPILEGTWAARQRMSPVYGTFLGAAEIFSLMRNGCDPRFLDFFSRDTCSQEEILAFQEFLFGLTTAEIKDLQKQNDRAAIGEDMVRQWSLKNDISMIQDMDDTTGFYTFFMKRHLVALSRQIGKLPGPHHTAEEYVMIHFIENYWKEILAVDGE